MGREDVGVNSGLGLGDHAVVLLSIRHPQIHTYVLM